jgi:murein DD-endopeptidase MepM/ murein hydrolase activator NlpD
MTEKYRLKSLNRVLSAFLVLGCIAATTAGAAPEIEVSTSTDKVTEGRFFSATVKPKGDQKLDTVSGRFMGRDLVFYPDKDGAYSALVGVEVDYKIGANTLDVRAKSADGAEVLQTKSIEVTAGSFPSETLKVQPRKVAPLKKDLPRIKRERTIIGRAYAASQKRRYWDPPLVMPIQSEITSIYGSKRVYNGIKQSAHYGTDLRAKVGTPILAPLAGRVALAMDLFFTGWTVVLDHGYGFFTIYAHMSKINVKPGTDVKKSEVLGLSGATGRVSGPHLHWGAQLHGIKVDPMSMMEDLK